MGIGLGGDEECRVLKRMTPFCARSKHHFHPRRRIKNTRQARMGPIAQESINETLNVRL